MPASAAIPRSGAALAATTASRRSGSSGPSTSSSKYASARSREGPEPPRLPGADGERDAEGPALGGGHGALDLVVLRLAPDRQADELRAVGG